MRSASAFWAAPAAAAAAFAATCRSTCPLLVPDAVQRREPNEGSGPEDQAALLRKRVAAHEWRSDRSMWGAAVVWGVNILTWFLHLQREGQRQGGEGGQPRERLPHLDRRRRRRREIKKRDQEARSRSEIKKRNQEARSRGKKKGVNGASSGKHRARTVVNLKVINAGAERLCCCARTRASQRPPGRGPETYLLPRLRRRHPLEPRRLAAARAAAATASRGSLQACAASATAATVVIVLAATTTVAIAAAATAASGTVLRFERHGR